MSRIETPFLGATKFCQKTIAGARTACRRASNSANAVHIIGVAAFCLFCTVNSDKAWAPRIPGLLEHIQQPLYDRSVTDVGGVNALNFFQVPLGPGVGVRTHASMNQVDRDGLNVRFCNLENGGSLIDNPGLDIDNVDGGAAGVSWGIGGFDSVLAIFLGIGWQNGDVTVKTGEVSVAGQNQVCQQPNGGTQVIAGVGPTATEFRQEFDDLSGLIGIGTTLSIAQISVAGQKMSVGIAPAVSLGLSRQDTDTDIMLDYDTINFGITRQDDVTNTRYSIGGKLSVSANFEGGLSLYGGVDGDINFDDVDARGTYIQNAGGTATVTGTANANDQTTSGRLFAGAGVLLGRFATLQIEGFMGTEEQWVSENVPGQGMRLRNEDVDFAGGTVSLSIFLDGFFRREAH